MLSLKMMFDGFDIAMGQPAFVQCFKRFR